MPVVNFMVNLIVFCFIILICQKKAPVKKLMASMPLDGAKCK